MGAACQAVKNMRVGLYRVLVGDKTDRPHPVRYASFPPFCCLHPLPFRRSAVVEFRCFVKLGKKTPFCFRRYRYLANHRRH